MSKQHIKTFREFNRWRRGEFDAEYPENPVQLDRALDHVVIMAERYEKLRQLNPRQFSELYARNLAGEGTFDNLVDGLDNV